MPLGATLTPDGANFAVCSRHATAITLELFSAPAEEEPTNSFRLDPQTHKSGDVWHIFVSDVSHGQLYGFRVDGPYVPRDGHRFNRNKLLMDPYTKAIAGHYATGHPALFGHQKDSSGSTHSPSTLNSAASTARSVVLSDSFDWQGVSKPLIPEHEMVIYEVHVRGLSKHHSSPAKSKGTYRGVVECIPHLKQLGINTVELLPIHEFDAGEHAGLSPKDGKQLHNYWGYSTLGFFAPEQKYAEDKAPDAVVNEFKYMVRELHRAGIEVILDVVYNHTGEGSEEGPTLSFRGLDNRTYYALDDCGNYKNYSGCGNSLNCNHPNVRTLILDSLRYWAVDMQVDGFRFDLATILGRDEDGAWITTGRSLVHDISTDPILRGTKLIAESWDAGGLYKVGEFPDRWYEWNGRYRDDVRRFLRGDPGLIQAIAWRLGGSADLFGWKSTPSFSINFITCHDGFTLRDLQSYERKHNELNGEDNRDGSNDNHSTNHGVEGPTDSVEIQRRRLRNAKNAMTLLMVSRGTPMMLGGDELWRTKQGNNNTYNQDNPLAWLDWSTSQPSEEILRFTSILVNLRRTLPALRRHVFSSPTSPNTSDLVWHGIQLHAPDMKYHSQSLAFHALGNSSTQPAERGVYVAINMWQKPLQFELPPHIRWVRAVDTSLNAPNDATTTEQSPEIVGDTYTVASKAIVVLVERY